MIKVYAVVTDWATYDDNGCNVKLFSSYDKALNEFNKVVEEEKTKNWSSVIDKEGKVKEGYILEEDKDYFKIYEDNDYNDNHTEMWIEEKEVY